MALNYEHGSILHNLLICSPVFILSSEYMCLTLNRVAGNKLWVLFKGLFGGLFMAWMLWSLQQQGSWEYCTVHWRELLAHSLALSAHPFVQRGLDLLWGLVRYIWPKKDLIKEETKDDELDHSQEGSVHSLLNTEF